MGKISGEKNRDFLKKRLMCIGVTLFAFYLGIRFDYNVSNSTNFSNKLKLPNYNQYIRERIYERYLWTQINLDNFVYKTDRIFMDYYNGHRLMCRSFSVQIDLKIFLFQHGFVSIYTMMN